MNNWPQMITTLMLLIWLINHILQNFSINLKVTAYIFHHFLVSFFLYKLVIKWNLVFILKNKYQDVPLLIWRNISKFIILKLKYEQISL